MPLLAPLIQKTWSENEGAFISKFVHNKEIFS